MLWFIYSIECRITNFAFYSILVFIRNNYLKTSTALNYRVLYMNIYPFILSWLLKVKMQNWLRNIPDQNDNGKWCLDQLIAKELSIAISGHSDRTANRVSFFRLLIILLRFTGRTHRSNQVNAPEYVFLISELAGEQRFASTVAKRLESLVRF